MDRCLDHSVWAGVFYLMDVALGGGGSEYVNDYVARERDCARPPEKGAAKANGGIRKTKKPGA